MNIRRHIFNLIIVWTLTGFWHGAAWNFLFWGFYYGVLLIMEKYIWGNRLKQLPPAIQHFYTLFIIVVGWVFFFSSGLKEALAYLDIMFGIGTAGLSDSGLLFLIRSNWLLLFAALAACVPLPFRAFMQVKNAFYQKYCANIIYLLLFLISIASLVSGTFNPFLYFRF